MINEPHDFDGDINEWNHIVLYSNQNADNYIKIIKKGMFLENLIK